MSHKFYTKETVGPLSAKTPLLQPLGNVILEMKKLVPLSIAREGICGIL